MDMNKDLLHMHPFFKQFQNKGGNNMSGPQFFETGMGRKFYEVIMPEIARQMKRANDLKEQELALKEKELAMKEESLALAKKGRDS
ncbi:MAG: hypothetical protein ACOCQR_00805 [bacterium]